MKAAHQLQVGMKLLHAMRSQWWPAERICAYQERALVSMMRHAINNVPFYQRLNLPAHALNTAADLDRLPVITKRDIQRDPQSFLARGYEPVQLYASRTSGSSGQPTTTYFDHNAWLLGKYALKMRRIIATAGLPLLKRVLIISEQPPEQLPLVVRAAPSGLGFFFQQRYLSIHTPAEQHLAVFANYRPDLVYAFPSYLLDLISIAERRHQSLPKVAALYTSSEVLTPVLRKRIEAAFSGRLFDIYGSTEFKEVAWQCAAGCYHLNFESVYVEPQTSGASNPVVLSSLSNKAMPLLRFDIGDRAVFGSGRCSCGRASLHMTEFSGREGDMVTLPSRRTLSPYLLTTAIESEESILQYRIVQTQADAFRIDVIVNSPGKSRLWHQRVCAELCRIVGEPVDFSVREVEALERTASGKRSVFVRAPDLVG